MSRTTILVFTIIFALSCGPLHKPIELVSLPYGFKITDNDFVKISGDFYEVKYTNENNLYVNVRFYTGNDKYGPIIESLIRAPEGHELALENSDVTVTSSKFGSLVASKWHSQNKYPTLYFIKPIPFVDKEQVKTLLQNDIITIKVNGKSYQFIGPE